MRALIGLLVAGVLIWIGAVPSIAEHIALLIELGAGLMAHGLAELLAQAAVVWLLIAFGAVHLARNGRAA